MNKKDVNATKILDERLFFDTSSPSTSTFGGKKLWLSVAGMDLFFKRKLQIKNVMLGLIKNLKTNYCIWVRYAQCHNAGESKDFEWDL